MQLKRKAVVRFTVAGFHCWPDAPMWRAYLRERHRHLFHFEVSLEVRHNERDVEFHDLLTLCQDQYPATMEFGDRSCEAIAEELIGVLKFHYPDRRMSVGVFEDGEVGAVVSRE